MTKVKAMLLSHTCHGDVYIVNTVVMKRMHDVEKVILRPLKVEDY